MMTEQIKEDSWNVVGEKKEKIQDSFTAALQTAEVTVTVPNEYFVKTEQVLNL